ncbi:hypothetical protein ACFLZ7_03835 [Nanoarchaeota archaeon]
MIIVNVQFKSVEVVKFNVKEGIEFKINFDDGEARTINRSSLIENPEALAEETFIEIRKMEKRYNQQYGGDSFDDVIIIRFDDEEKIMQKMAGFFQKVKDKVKLIRSSSDASNYLDKINDVNRSKIEF